MKHHWLKVGEYVKCDVSGTQRVLEVSSCDAKLSSVKSRAYSAKQILPTNSNLFVFLTQAYGEKAVIQGMTEREVERLDPFEAKLLLLQGIVK